MKEIILTYRERKLIKALLINEIESFGNTNNLLRIEYQYIFEKVSL